MTRLANGSGDSEGIEVLAMEHVMKPVKEWSQEFNELNKRNNNNNKFLYSAFHNNRINALYSSAQGSISQR